LRRCIAPLDVWSRS